MEEEQLQASDAPALVARAAPSRLGRASGSFRLLSTASAGASLSRFLTPRASPGPSPRPGPTAGEGQAAHAAARTPRHANPLTCQHAKKPDLSPLRNWDCTVISTIQWPVFTTWRPTLCSSDQDCAGSTAPSKLAFRPSKQHKHCGPWGWQGCGGGQASCGRGGGGRRSGRSGAGAGPRRGGQPGARVLEGIATPVHAMHTTRAVGRRQRQGAVHAAHVGWKTCQEPHRGKARERWCVCARCACWRACSACWSWAARPPGRPRSWRVCGTALTTCPRRTRTPRSWPPPRCSRPCARPPARVPCCESIRALPDRLSCIPHQTSTQGKAEMLLEPRSQDTSQASDLFLMLLAEAGAC